MKLESISDYEKYVVISNYTKMFLGTYPNFFKTKRTDAFFEPNGIKE